MGSWMTIIDFVVVAAVLGIFAWKQWFPSTTALHEIVEMLNTKGGNILLLATMALMFFKGTMHLGYTVLEQIEAHTLHEDNAIALMLIGFCTTSAFGGAMGAMLTLISGDARKPTPTSTETTTVSKEVAGPGNGK